MELVNTYNVERQRLIQTTDRHTPLAPGEYIVIVHALILNTNGEILIQQRANDKSLWANLWDISCSGAPIAGETSAEGIAREIKEELGWSIDFLITMFISWINRYPLQIFSITRKKYKLSIGLL